MRGDEEAEVLRADSQEVEEEARIVRRKRAPMPILPIQRARVCDQVAGSIFHLIADGTFKVGTRLPNERSLAFQFGVNRESIREALRYLEAQGMIAVRHGNGSFVAATKSRDEEIMELRSRVALLEGRAKRALMSLEGLK